MGHTNQNNTSKTRFVRVALNSVLLAGLVALPACESFRNKKDRITFHGVQFRAKADKVDKNNRRVFNVNVKPASASLEGAREAGRYEGTKYCIDNYGTSQIKWILGPDEDPSKYRIENDVLTLQGRCMP